MESVLSGEKKKYSLFTYIQKLISVGKLVLVQHLLYNFFFL